MPMYAYACKDCGHAFDVQQAFSDHSLTVCPECSGVLRKKFNSVGVVFKGSGFYRNDSRDAKTSTDAGASSSSSSESSSAASTATAASTSTSKASAASSSTSDSAGSSSGSAAAAS